MTLLSGSRTGFAEEATQKPSVFLMTNTLETGGSERQFVTMAKALDRDLFSVSLGCLKPFGPFLDEVEGIQRFAAGGSLFGLQSWRSRLTLARLLRKKQIAVAQSFDFYSNLMLIPAARWAGVPVVLGSHRQLGDLLTFTQFQTQNAAFRCCSRVVCNSRAAAQRLQDAGVPARKLTVIPNALPEELFSLTPLLSREPRVVKIGMISRMNHRIKQHDLFLRMAARLSPRFPQVQFVLVGDGPLRPELEALTGKLNLPERVKFLGDRRDIPAVMASLDISVMPSSSESLSNVILESMAAGVPVVAADVGGNPELIENGKNGFLFPPGDEGQFVSALETLITQPELRKQMAALARIQAEKYTVPQIKDRYQELYRDLLAEKGWTAPLALENARTTGVAGEAS